MGKSNQAVSEVQLKARRTSLGKKSVDELITIILRKDKSERSMNSKIQELQDLIKRNDEQGAYMATRMVKIEEMSEVIKVKQEQIDNLTLNVNKIENERNEALKKINHLKYLCKFRRNVIFACFGIIAILVILLFMF